MYKIILAALLLAYLSLGAQKRPVETIQLTVINKSGMEIAVQLRARPESCVNCSDTMQGAFYYLKVPEGDKDSPVSKVFDIEKDSYGMQLFYLETYDPVYGFKCGTTQPNALLAVRNLRLVVLPCDQTPRNVGEPSMRKYLPYTIKEMFMFDRYWITRFVY